MIRFLYKYLLPVVMLSLVTIVSLASAATLDNWHQSEFILNSFREIALKNEYRTHNGRVRKWQQPVKVWLDHRVADKQLHTDLMSKHIVDLKRITGHDIRLVSEKSAANVIVVFSRYEQMASIARDMMGGQIDAALKEALCLGNIRATSDEEIIAASIIIPVDQARAHGKLVSCIVEETTQILGLVNDSEAVYPSIFNDRTPNDLLTGLDYLLLRILYDQRIKPGMSSPQAMAQAGLIVAEMQRSGLVKKAVKEVRKGELYALLGY